MVGKDAAVPMNFLSRKIRKMVVQPTPVIYTIPYYGQQQNISSVKFLFPCRSSCKRDKLLEPPDFLTAYIETARYMKATVSGGPRKLERRVLFAREARAFLKTH